MSDIERLVRTWIGGSSREEEVDKIVSGMLTNFTMKKILILLRAIDVSNDRATFKDIVLALGPYLTNEDDDPRTQGKVRITLTLYRLTSLGVELLSCVLQKVTPRKLSNQTGTPYFM
jgi:hypothetical protein